MHTVKNVYIILVGPPEQKRPCDRNRHRRHDNIKMDLKETWGRCGLRLCGSG